MTGNDHNSNAIIAALRQPALPSERVDETVAVAAMVEAQMQVSAASKGPRPRRVAAIAAITVASLGLGGLAAAGPGIFSPAADRPEPSTPVDTTVPDTAVDPADDPGADPSAATLPDTTRNGAEGSDTDDESPGKSGDAPGQNKTDNESPGKSGDAPGQNKTDNESPGKSGDAPGQTGETPGQTGETPGQTGGTPDDPPGNSGKNKP